MSDVLKVAVKRVVPSQRDPKAWSLELECGHWVFRTREFQQAMAKRLRTFRLR